MILSSYRWLRGQLDPAGSGPAGTTIGTIRMARNSGRHRISRRTKIVTGAVSLAIAVGGVVIVSTAGDPGTANADAANPSFFVDITKVKANVQAPPKAGGNASKGTFTVDCGRNEN